MKVHYAGDNTIERNVCWNNRKYGISIIYNDYRQEKNFENRVHDNSLGGNDKDIHVVVEHTFWDEYLSEECLVCYSLLIITLMTGIVIIRDLRKVPHSHPAYVDYYWYVSNRKETPSSSPDSGVPPTPSLLLVPMRTTTPPPHPTNNNHNNDNNNGNNNNHNNDNDSNNKNNVNSSGKR